MKPRRLGTRRRRPLGLRARIAVVVAVVCAAGTTVMALMVYRFQADSSTERFTLAADVGFASDLQQARARVHQHPGGNRLETVTHFVREREGMHWALYEFAVEGKRPVPVGGVYSDSVADGQAVVRSKSLVVPAWLVDRARTGATASTEFPDRHGNPVYLVAGLVEPDLVLVEEYSMRRLHDDLSALRHTLAVVAVVVTVLSAGAALQAAHFAQRPVRAAARAARRFGTGELYVRLPVRGGDELAELAREFNDMAERLGTVIAQLHAKDRQQQRFIADAAHDLRTPVATMVASVDSLDDPATRAVSASLLGEQTRRLARLVEDLLEISRFDAGTAQLRPDRCELPELVEDVVSLVAPDSDVTVRVTGDTTVVADPRRLHTVLSNLITNALVHGAPPVTVEVGGTDPNTVVLRVADHGPGVPDDLLPAVFDRFVRGDAARTDGGTGLGLAIAVENVTVHGGRIEVTRAGGAVFTVTLPRTPPGHTGTAKD
ncbi:HAMP domain-containing sensor histidine kinase [Saccharomonospora cyanea]|uniref:histidine kinase n=1 Tax=Saccharomonospora cyanea NA-134 TaxID=882082 RepID=H5XMF4_9PSEU|nr:HAMP domain-containing sensor histidine kinase [Saccharomonospora cyanea]EHR59903.1 signal transduction histidine kinase [Saccharomonospora cyanea NA-134]